MGAVGVLLLALVVRVVWRDIFPVDPDDELDPCRHRRACGQGPGAEPGADVDQLALLPPQ